MKVSLSTSTKPRFTKETKKSIIGFIGMIGFISAVWAVSYFYYNSYFVDYQVERFQKSNTCWDLVVTNMRGGEGLFDYGLIYMFLSQENIDKLSKIATEKGKVVCVELQEIIQRTHFISDDGKAQYYKLECDDFATIKKEFPKRTYHDIDQVYYQKDCHKTNGVLP